MLAVTRRRADEVAAILVPRLGRATLEVIAANAVLAGALPEHLSVILAALEAMADPAFNLQAIQTTTHPCSPLLIVNGPIVRRLGIHAGGNVLGQGARANAVIGRAVRLVLQNVGGERPGKCRQREEQQRRQRAQREQRPAIGPALDPEQAEERRRHQAERRQDQVVVVPEVAPAGADRQRRAGRAQPTWTDRLAMPIQKPSITLRCVPRSASAAPSVTNSGAKCSVRGWASRPDGDLR